MIKKVWVVEEGIYFKDGTHIDSIHFTKKSAEAKCRNEGFIRNQFESMFLNKKEQLYREIYSKRVIEVLAKPIGHKNYK